MTALPQYWLMKSEPEECSIDDALAAPAATVPWTGVRNYQARNFMRDAMRVGDGVLFYHSSCAEPGIVGIARVASGAKPDPTQFEPGSPYHDQVAKPEAPRWLLVEVQALRKTRVLGLAAPDVAVRVRPARPSDVPDVAAVLGAAADALRRRGQALWSAREVSEAAILPSVEQGLYHLGWVDGEPVGVFRLQWEDPDFWPEVAEGCSAYLHKLAVLPARQGSGVAQALLGHACQLARRGGRQFLRLDCMGGRPSLSAVYEKFGFRRHSPVRLGGVVFNRFEMDLGMPCTTADLSG